MSTHVFLLLSIIVISIVGMASGSRDPCTDEACLADALKEMCQKSVTRAGLADNLAILRDRGLLKEDLLENVSRSNLRRKINKAMEDHAATETPYGRVVQKINLGGEVGWWEYIHPLAFLHHLTAISAALGSLLSSLVQPGEPLRIIIYCDACDPGNPLRPEATRKLMCIYWTFIDFPQYILQRSAAWFSFGFLRTKMIDKLDGGLSELMAKVLQIFFLPDSMGNCFSRGVTLVNQTTSFMVRSIFAGFLADDEAHTFINGLKGASGIKSCMKCQNVTTIDSDYTGGWLVHVGEPDHNKFVPNTNEDVYAVADLLATTHNAGQATRLEKIAKTCGIKYTPPMGYCSPNAFVASIDQSITRSLTGCIRSATVASPTPSWVCSCTFSPRPRCHHWCV